MARLKQVSIDVLREEAKGVLNELIAVEGIHLIRTPFDNPFIQLLWREHYVGSKGTVGRQIHYTVYYNGRAVGAISAGSAMFAHRKRDKILGVTKEEQSRGLRHIANNTMFRLIRPKDQPPLATDVLKIFRELVQKDWLKEYGDFVRAFETLVEPPRWGGIYKIDGWKKIGMTAGLGARRPEGHGTAGKASTGVRQIVRVPKKIVWIMPICSYEQAVLISKESTRSSYGDDAIKISAFFKAKANEWIASEDIVAATAIPHERVKTILYLMVNAERSITKNDAGLYQTIGVAGASAGRSLYGKADTKQMEFECLNPNTK